MILSIFVLRYASLIISVVVIVVCFMHIRLTGYYYSWMECFGLYR